MLGFMIADMMRHRMTMMVFLEVQTNQTALRSSDKLKETNPSLLIFIPFELLFVFFDKPVLNINNSNLD